MANDSFENTWTNQSTTDRLNDPMTPGKNTASDEYSSAAHPYDINGACVPDSKTAGGNLAEIEGNIRDRFALNTQDVFGLGGSADKKLY